MEAHVCSDFNARDIKWSMGFILWKPEGERLIFATWPQGKFHEPRPEGEAGSVPRKWRDLNN